MQSKTFYITGGQRSGKSGFGQKMALSLSKNPVYLATSRIWDEDFANRVARHKADRGSEWRVIEKEKYISELGLEAEVILMDCVTLWLNNFFVDHQYQVEPAIQEAKSEFDRFITRDNHLIIISNEIGMGTHAETEAGRKFTDLLGWMNQHVAKKSDEAYLMVSGIPLKIK